jgi:hypothetical protein
MTTGVPTPADTAAAAPRSVGDSPSATTAEPDLVEALRGALTPVPAVAAAWLFGSRARGTARVDSDLDIAVLFRPTLDIRQRHNATLDLLDALAAKLGSLGERADVLDLADAGAAVAFAAIRDGVCVVDRGDGVVVQTIARVARRYDDDAPRRALFASAVAERFRDR